MDAYNIDKNTWRTLTGSGVSGTSKFILPYTETQVLNVYWSGIASVYDLEGEVLVKELTPLTCKFHDVSDKAIYVEKYIFIL